MTYVQRHPLQSLGPIHPPKVDKNAIKPSVARPINIRVKDPLDHYAPAIIHEPRNYSAEGSNGSAVVLVSGAGGGVSGPAGTDLYLLTPDELAWPALFCADQTIPGIYPSLADKLTLLLSIPVIRLDYRLAANPEHCTSDIIASFNYLSQHYRTSRFVLVGWSFGGSPCFSAAAEEPDRLRGVATIASQTAHTAGISSLSPRPLLLLHATDDLVLASACSETLYRQYGSDGSRELKLFEGDDHGLSKHAPEVEGMLLAFAAKLLGFEKSLDTETMIQAGQDLVESSEERKKEMEEGRDLEEGEKLTY